MVRTPDRLDAVSTQYLRGTRALPVRRCRAKAGQGRDPSPNGSLGSIVLQSTRPNHPNHPNHPTHSSRPPAGDGVATNGRSERVQP
jgi:hypothetical protein